MSNGCCSGFLGPCLELSLLFWPYGLSFELLDHDRFFWLRGLLSLFTQVFRDLFFCPSPRHLVQWRRVFVALCYNGGSLLFSHCPSTLGMGVGLGLSEPLSRTLPSTLVTCMRPSPKHCSAYPLLASAFERGSSHLSTFDRAASH